MPPKFYINTTNFDDVKFKLFKKIAKSLGYQWYITEPKTFTTDIICIGIWDDKDMTCATLARDGVPEYDLQVGLLQMGFKDFKVTGLVPELLEALEKIAFVNGYTWNNLKTKNISFLDNKTLWVLYNQALIDCYKNDGPAQLQTLSIEEALILLHYSRNIQNFKINKHNFECGENYVKVDNFTIHASLLEIYNKFQESLK